MRVLILPTFYAHHLELSVSGRLSLCTATQVAQLLRLAHCYYRYPLVNLELSRATTSQHAADVLRTAIQSERTHGLRIELTATVQARALLEARCVSPSSAITRRIGFP